MVGVVIVLVIFAVICLLYGKRNKNLPLINKVNSIRDLVMSINFGRAYPFYTGMNLQRVKKVVKESNLNTSYFENELLMQELMGDVRGVKIPLSPNALLNEIYLSFNRNKIISSITLDISRVKFDVLIEEMIIKFGNPASFNSQFMTWKEACVTITIDSKNKYINIMDERLLRRC